MKCAKKMEAVHSDIRGPLYVEATKMEAAGTKILKLNSGNPAIFGHKGPESVKRAIIENIDKAVPYCDFRGMKQAREAIRDYYLEKGVKGVKDTDVYVGNGVSELADISLTAILDSGDEVLVPTPCYPLWSNCTVKVGGVPVFYNCDESCGWYPDIDDMRKKVSKRTKAIVVINPNNPTGALYPPEILSSIAEIAREHNLMIFSDEIYDRLVFDGKKHIPMAVLAPDVFVVTYNGLSKSHNVCGYRSGWMTLCGPEKGFESFRLNIEKLMSLRLCAGAIPQLIIPAALADTESTKAEIAPGGTLYERRRAAWEALESADSLSCVKNDGALYMFPRIDSRFKIKDDHDFAARLLREKHILLVPGSGFNYDSPNHFRIVLLPSPEQLSGDVRAIDELLKEDFI